MKTYLLSCLIVLIAVLKPAHSEAQGGTADNPVFLLPVDINPVLVANFGELRNNHFHGGIDLKTEHVVGKNLLAIADGYISRIKLEPAGYGIILFITHPQHGIVSGYAHMLGFSARIDSALYDYQFKVKSNTIDYADIPPYLLPVKKGEIIGLSGNTGASTGPHLHFEIRDLLTGDGLNPLAYFPQLDERARPSIHSVIITPLSPESTVNGLSQPVRLAAVRRGDGRFQASSVPTVKGAFGISVSALDKVTGSPHTFGIYSMALHLDGALIHQHKMDIIPYSDTRFLNAFVEYERKIRAGTFYEKTYIEPNNKLALYAHGQNQGVIYSTGGGHHTATVTAEDFYGNISQIEIPMEFVQHGTLAPDSSLTDKYWNDIFKTGDGCFIFVPKGSLYNNTRIELKKLATRAAHAQSPVYQFHTDECPAHLPVTVGIQADASMLADKTGLIICRVRTGGGLAPETSYWQGDFLCAETKYFGKFCIARDITPPTAAPLNFRINANARNMRSLRFRVADNLSGINQYNAFIDDNWTPVVYDRKTATMEVDLLDRVAPVDGKKHTIKLVLNDLAGNRRTASFTYYR